MQTKPPLGLWSKAAAGGWLGFNLSSREGALDQGVGVREG